MAIPQDEPQTGLLRLDLTAPTALLVIVPQGIPKWVARFNMRVTNRVTRTYRIPVSALPQPGGYRFA